MDDGTNTDRQIFGSMWLRVTLNWYVYFNVVGMLLFCSLIALVVSPISDFVFTHDVTMICGPTSLLRPL